MAYTPYYSGGWQSGEQGGTPITPAALNNMETGIGDALPKSGGTMTGSINMGQNSDNMAGNVVTWTSADGTEFYMRPNGNQWQFVMRPSGGSSVGLLNFGSNGSISVNDASGWRNAIAAASRANAEITAGTSITIPNIVINGHITNGGKDVVCYIPVYSNISGRTIAVTGSTITIRCMGTYVLNNASISSTFATTTATNENIGILLGLAASTAITNDYNNYPVSIQITNLAFTFS